MLLIGFFEGIDSERGIGWRVADSLSLRRFLNYGLNEATPDHVTISRTRRLLDEATHQAVFRFVLREVARRGLLKGKTIGIDATTLEANAAMRSIVRRDTSESYLGYLRRLAAEAGIDASDDDAVRRMDRKRKKKTSNKEWVNPHDREAEVTKMRDGTTHLAYKAEQAVDLETGAIVAISTHGGAVGDSESVQETLAAAGEAIAEQIATPTAQGQYKVHEQGLREVVTDKGYHSGAGLATMSGMGVRSYVSVPRQPRRNWEGKREQQAAVYANRRRVAGARGKSLLRRRGELLERPFAHQYETGAMRRLHVRGRGNVAKRVLLQAAAFNLALILRTMTRAGTPRGLADLKRKLFCALLRVLAALLAIPALAFRPGCKFTAQLSPIRKTAAQSAHIAPVTKIGVLTRAANGSANAPAASAHFCNSDDHHISRRSDTLDCLRSDSLVRGSGTALVSHFSCWAFHGCLCPFPGFARWSLVTVTKA